MCICCCCCCCWTVNLNWINNFIIIFHFFLSFFITFQRKLGQQCVHVSACVCVRVFACAYESGLRGGGGGGRVGGVCLQRGLIWLVYQLIKGQSKCQRENKRNFYALCMREKKLPKRWGEREGAVGVQGAEREGAVEEWERARGSVGV